MAVHEQRTQPSIFLTFKVLQFVTQLRRRLKPRSDTVTSPSILGPDPCLGLALEPKGLGTIAKGLSRVCFQERKQLQHSSYRVSKGRKNRCARPSLKLQLLEQGDAPIPDASAGKVQHMLSSLDTKRTASGDALSAVAGNAALFLKQNNSANFESCSLNDTIQYLAAVHDAINVLNACRSQYDDEWLIAQGAELGLSIDELFIANYEHLLLCLRGELIDTLAHKVLEELLDGGHDKRQRRLLNWFSEFSDKPRPLSTFPWTIKPSLAVLWGVCWMFYNGPGHENEPKAGESGDRVPQARVLQNLDFSSWTVPGSDDCEFSGGARDPNAAFQKLILVDLNFGLELTGTQSQPGAQQQAGTVGPGSVDFQARNADTWPADLVSTEFQMPSVGIRHAGAGGASRAAGAAPHSAGLSTYYPNFPQGFNPIPSHQHHRHPLKFNHHLSHHPSLPVNSGTATPLTVFPNQIDVNVNSLTQSWQPLPPSSLPHNSPRHLTGIPSVRVTADSEGYTPPQDFASYDIYPADLPAPQAPRQLNLITNLSAYDSSAFNMGNVQPPETSPVVHSLPGPRHERTPSVNSNSNIPTPVSMAGPRSPLLSPSNDRRPSITSCHSHIRRQSEDLSSVDGDEAGSPRRNHAYKRAEEPPRNLEGKMICKQPECIGQTFDRKCEWSKHMDKHDRPYKCNVKGCEKLQGFTYSGGLLRHEREVHKMHGGTKKSLYCPFPDCKRSSGSGFTRKENLAEHIRRVHRRTSMSVDLGGLIIHRRDSSHEPMTNDMRMSSEGPFSRLVDVREDEEHISLKRKRMSDSGLPDSGVEELHSELKRLRRENEEKDARLRQLEQAVMALQQSSRR